MPTETRHLVDHDQLLIGACCSFKVLLCRTSVESRLLIMVSVERL
jgi:hypothetical protein